MMNGLCQEHSGIVAKINSVEELAKETKKETKKLNGKVTGVLISVILLLISSMLRLMIEYADVLTKAANAADAIIK